MFVMMTRIAKVISLLINIQNDSCQTLSIPIYFVFIADNFDLGYDIQQYFALHQNLFLEDLARTNSRHTLNGLMRVVSKVRSFLFRMIDATSHVDHFQGIAQKLFMKHFFLIFIKTKTFSFL